MATVSVRAAAAADDLLHPFLSFRKAIYTIIMGNRHDIHLGILYRHQVLMVRVVVVTGDGNDE